MGCQHEGWQGTERKERSRSEGKACASTLNLVLAAMAGGSRKMSPASRHEAMARTGADYTDSVCRLLVGVMMQQLQKKRRPKGRRFLLLELPAQARRYAAYVGLFPRAIRADRAAPTVAPAIIGALTVEDIGLVIQHINPQTRIPMAWATGWRRKGGRGAGQWLGRLGNRHIRQRLT